MYTQFSLPIDIPNIDDSGFLKSECNSFACKFVESWPSILTNYYITILTGEKKCGKTTLLHLWQNKNKAFEIKPIKHLDKIIQSLENNKYFIIDDIFRWSKLQEQLLHIINYVVNNKKHLLITNNYTNFNEIFNLTDLASRLSSFNVIKIESVDSSLAKQLLMKNFIQYQIRLKKEFIDFIIDNYELSYSLIEEISKKIIDYIVNNNNKNLTLKMLKEIIT
ncbi:MAG: hypothetical protein J0H68_06445 [Sphingobacteriia bacterium]|nr:hypothetical protein [Sphingobacteriia bacterium]